MTLRAVILGIVIGILFGAANAYLGLKVGLTVSASIPAAVMAVSVFRALRRMRLTSHAGVLENNMVQTIGSAGESLAAGVIFTVPALILLGFSPGVLRIFVLGSLGGVLGILFMVPLRRYLVVREHERLIYPEGTACASVLEAGHEKGAGGGLVFAGLGVGAAFEFITSGLGLWKGTAAWKLPRVPAAEVSAETSPALLGVGYVIGPRIAAVIFGGGALAWLVFIPAIRLFAEGSDAIYPAPVPVAELDTHGIWHYYVRYIGAGAVVFGGIVTLIKSLPVIGRSVSAVISGAVSRKKDRAEPERTDRDLPGGLILAGVLVILAAMALLPGSMAPGGFIPALLAAVFAFFFVAVSSRIVGLIGSSSNPVSGMTIAALLFTTVVFKLLGWTDQGHQYAALTVGAVVCISAAIAGDTSQDLKTGWLVGATPWRQQAAEIIGVLTSAAVIGFVVLTLNDYYGIGSEKLPAPQATLMSLVVKGVLTAELPWTLVFIGAAAAAVVEVLGIHSLPFAVGLYLPLSLSTPILLGGGVRWLVDGFMKKESPGGQESDEAESKEGLSERERSLLFDRGVLFASGLIAGAAFVGMGLALAGSLGGKSADKVIDEMKVGHDWSGRLADPVSFIALAALAALLLYVSLKKRN